MQVVHRSKKKVSTPGKMGCLLETSEVEGCVLLKEAKSSPAHPDGEEQRPREGEVTAVH